ncbi:MAG: hypothetical protein QXG97_07130, partial [Nitrososphaerota archaeon]
TVQKICRRAKDEEEVRETLDNIWKQPEKGEEIIKDLSEKNEEVYQFEKMLEETVESPTSLSANDI